MLRIALRRSARTVGAASLSGRASAVSDGEEPNHALPYSCSLLLCFQCLNYTIIHVIILQLLRPQTNSPKRQLCS